MLMRTCTPKMLAAAVLLLACGAAAGLAQPGPGTVTITYTLHHQPRIASNQLAVWIEDPEGRHVRTLFATDFMARRQGFRRRPLCCPEWVQASGLEGWSRERIDAVSGATQKPGVVSLSWDCTDAEGRPVPPGEYLYRIEGNLFWERRVLWTGRIRVGGAGAESEAAAAYLPDASAEEAGPLVEAVSARFQPRRADAEAVDPIALAGGEADALRRAGPPLGLRRVLGLLDQLLQEAGGL